MTRTLEVTGGTLVYDTFGDAAETIVFVHGAGGNHLSWWQQIPHFRGRFRCVAYEVRGWGQSKDLSGEGRAAFRRDLEELMDQIEIPHAVLVGQSMGGFSVLPYAVHNSGRVRGLLMADTFLGIWDEQLLREMAQVVERAQANAEDGGQTMMVGPDFIERNPNGLFLYQQVRGLNPPLETGGTALTFGVDQGAVAVDDLTALTMPVIFLAGELDAIIPAPLIKAASEHVPGARYVEVPRGGHSVYWELPDHFNAILDDLLAEAYPGK